MLDGGPGVMSLPSAISSRLPELLRPTCCTLLTVPHALQEKHSSSAEPVFKPERARELESKVAIGVKPEPVMKEGNIPGTLEPDHRDHNKY